MWNKIIKDKSKKRFKKKNKLRLIKRRKRNSV